MSAQLTDKVDALVSSIDELEEVLKPLLETPLSKLTTQLSTPLDRAKLQTWLSYVLNDLVWIYLRTRGINPSHTDSGEPHDVVAELDRVKEYFAKIKEAENPAKRTMVVDGKVANRFIKHALASAISPANFESSSSSQKPTHIRFDDEQSSSTQPPAPTESNVEPNEEESSSDSDAEPEVGTWKAKKRAREADLAKQRAGEDEEVESDESLDGWEEANSGSAAAADLEQAEVQEGPASRAKRPRYSQPRSKRSEPAETTAKSTPSSSTPVPQPSRDPDQQVDDTASRLSPASASAPSTSSAPVGKKVRRKNKGGARHRKTSKNAPSQK